ncbi:chitin synthase 4 [Fimicolochytrium jonesii]|uniref:chitin synthase 4 n=1 Tax=Fimicolochytrium jonesii TaxID=1396493 RepID=UPI0022FDCF0C|nr:chitin synthase 4 [Fimicolochytrium jonesii]KAI8816343.1 chitin synthase 4 [Fimicolochytrium jonesii]
MTDPRITTTRPRTSSTVTKSNKVGIEIPPQTPVLEVITEGFKDKDKPLKPGDDGDSKVEEKDRAKPKPALKRQKTAARTWWVRFTWFSTWWIPTWCIVKVGRMKSKDVQMAWREKVALCVIILFMCGLMIFFVEFFSKLMCPNAKIFAPSEVAQHNVLLQSNLFVSWNGHVYDMNNYVAKHVDPKYTVLAVAGKDVSPWFPRIDPTTGAIDAACPNVTPFYPGSTGNSTCTAPGYTNAYCHKTNAIERSINVYHDSDGIYKVGDLAYSADTVYEHGKSNDAWIIVNGRFYDVTEIIKTTSWMISAFDAEFVQYLDYYKGRDASQVYTQFQKLGMMKCLENQFFVGVVDDRLSIAACYASQYILLGCTGIMVFILVIKFLAALQLGSKRQPEHYDRFVILQVPCYTEGEDSLRKTIDSLALLEYDDTRKLLLIVADGNVKGAGNDLPTPEIALKLLGVDLNAEKPPPKDYLAIGEGGKAHNRAQVYSGLYRIQARAVPYIVVVKCGKESETNKAGNRGKRDSQMILMKFLNKVHYQTLMTPLDLEMYHHIKNIIGVHPYLYEYVLMVDADTEVVPDSLNRLISCAVHDGKIMGICGETKIANEKQSWVTMMQVYEYYISHHMAKAFESLFGTVTCLPGCFSMYRIRTPTKKIPLLASSDIIAEYEENIVDTLHKKNLLSLGEDRFLTTLMLKYFPEYRTKFTADARCYTIVPDSIAILLSQRRRWINSTIHNLFELLFLPHLCGCIIFSMRFVVFLDLFATLIMPATTGYLAYLIYSAVQAKSAPVISLIMLGAAYGLQAIIFIIKREYQHIGWMIINILAMPVFSFWLPIYSFWHFDDFSWGSTRRIAGAQGKDTHGGDDELFDPSVIPLVKWDDYEAMMIEREQEEESDYGYDQDGTDGSHPSEYGAELNASFSIGGAPRSRQGSALSHSNNNSRPTSRPGSARSDYSSYSHGAQDPRRRSMASYSGSAAGMQQYGPYGGGLHPGSYTAGAQSTYRGSQPNIHGHGGGHPGYAPSIAESERSLSGIHLNSSQPRRPSERFGSQQSLNQLGALPEHTNLQEHLDPTSPAAADKWTGGAPTDEDLAQRIRYVISRSDLRDLTKRKVRESLSTFFGRDLEDRKGFIGAKVEAILLGKE